jgi:hypothetical protein
MEVDNTLPPQGHSHARAVPGDTHAAEVDDDSDGEDDEETFEAEAEQADDVANIAEACRLAGAEGVGEGKRKLSWIWVVGLKFENLEDNRLLDGTCHFPLSLIFVPNVCNRLACRIGEVPGSS